MAAKNLNPVLMSVLVGNNLPVQADRIGSGLVMAYDILRDFFLSQGHTSQPQFPDPEHRVRQVVIGELSTPPVEEPVEPNGNIPGTPACSRSTSLARTELLGTLDRTAGTTLGNRSTVATAIAGWPPAADRASYPGSLLSSHRIGRDCQSPDREFDKQDLKSTQHTQTWHRMTCSTQQAGK